MVTVYTYTLENMFLNISNEKINEEKIDYLKSTNMGFIPSWIEYINFLPPEIAQMIVLLRHAIIDLGWIGKTASQILDDWNFHFTKDDSTIIINFTNKAWGEFMSAVENKRSGYQNYYY